MLAIGREYSESSVVTKWGDGMTDVEIRNNLREFLGNGCYLRFVFRLIWDLRINWVIQSDSDHPLRFWQEQRWQQFRELYPSATSDVTEIKEVFFWCHIHDRKLAYTGENQLFPEVHMSAELSAAISQLFQFTVGRLVCPDCISARDVWISQHDCSILRRKTTWEEYVAAHGTKTTPAFIRALKSGKRFIESEMRDGEELWEWDNGTGITGLAIVQDEERRISWNAPLE